MKPRFQLHAVTINFHKLYYSLIHMSSILSTLALPVIFRCDDIREAVYVDRCQGMPGVRPEPPPKWGWTTKQNKGVKLIGRFTLPRKWWDLVFGGAFLFFKRDSQSMSTSRFHWDFTFLNWHANLSEWNNSKPPASDHRHGAARLKSCGAFFCRFCGCCARARLLWQHLWSLAERMAWSNRSKRCQCRVAKIRGSRVQTGQIWQPESPYSDRLWVNYLGFSENWSF